MNPPHRQAEAKSRRKKMRSLSEKKRGAKCWYDSVTRARARARGEYVLSGVVVTQMHSVL